jgi:hypothetical protein
MLRFEYKYFFPVGQLEKLRAMIQPFMELDKHAEADGGEYTVRSIYFDTHDLECYYQKLAGVKRRNKVRMRGYNNEEDGNLVFFEIKKKVDEPLFKNRAPLTFDDARKILAGEPLEGSVASTKKLSKTEAVNNARRFMYHIHARQLQPVVTVIYEREPYQSILKDRKNDLRITFDKNLRAVPYPALDELFKEKITYEVDPRFFILEIKFNQYLPAWAKAIVASLGLKKGPASKYVMCIEACPEISPGQRHHILSSGQLPLPNFKLVKPANGKKLNGNTVTGEHCETNGHISPANGGQPIETCSKNFSK